MKILLTTNKTYRGLPDLGEWYLNQPLTELGHEVYWYDTVNPEMKDYKKIIENFKPDLIFSCLTGNRAITPYEPWDEIQEETKSGRTKTFNWFCDDTWRFESPDPSSPVSGSRKTCRVFTACSTPEPDFVQKYKDSGYKNILLATWHANSKFYSPLPWAKREHPLLFIGAMNAGRDNFFKRAADRGIRLDAASGMPNEQMFELHSNVKIGINMSINFNDPLNRSQMKQRVFEIAAGRGMMFSQYHKGIEEFFEIDKEVVMFKTPDEFASKAKFLTENDSVAAKIAEKGHERFLAEHDSKVRLSKLLKQIKEI